MNYSRNIRKKAIGRRVMLSWVVAVLIGIVIGFILGFVVCSIRADASEPEEYIEEFPGEENVPHFSITIEEVEGKTEDPFVPLDVPLDADIQRYINDLCEDYGIEFTFVMALIQHESNYRANVVSKTNDYGLMQINKCNHSSLKKTLGVTDFLDPYQNVRAGMYMLNDLFQKYGDPSKVLMAYNMGEGAAKKLWNKGTYSSAYSRTILNIQKELEMKR